jgi:crotonobetainyl-CoA:carnitine CoA-transferase CaiB-like acyl-CoA transferase
VIENEQVVQNKIFEIHDDPVLGKVRQPRPAARFDRTPAEVKAMAPFLGADNTAILSELGYSEDEIGAFGKDGVVKTDTG